MPTVLAFWISISATLVSVIFYWLARIIYLKVFNLPFRHFLELLFLVFPLTFVSCSLLLREMWVLFSVILILVLFFLVALEIFLRRITAGIGGGTKSEVKYGIGRNGVQVKYPEALMASGDYPRHYMTESFFQSIQYDTMRVEDYDSSGISIKNGIRSTTDQPKLFQKTLLFFGGHTTFGREVPDDLTFESFLQRKINHYSKLVRVVNYGRGGNTVIESVRWLISEVLVEPGDVIVFYFGANDCGSRVGRKKSRQVSLRSPLLFLLGRFSDHKVQLLHWVHAQLVSRHNHWCAKTQFKITVREFKKAREWSETKGAKLFIVLQPIIYMSKATSTYEDSLRPRFSSFFREQFKIAYPMYGELVKNCGFGLSATHVLDNLSNSVYLDWSHLNARGNEIVASFLYDSLDERGLLN